ncbi:RnfH family protein [Cysteiniphilum halobium]|uniref:RnfH family protein n=1 Tax=Cysteiniphilum halobium TaxID=2219059 RepID=UPI000E646631|nr:RnfH family protein [Cysteiniphilum halobium]
MKMLPVEVVYADSKKQKLYQLECHENSSVKDVITQSGVLSDFPEIDLNVQSVGIYSDIVTLDHIVKSDDRIEIYRMLTIDPKDARRIRAEEKRKKDGLKLFGA